MIGFIGAGSRSFVHCSLWNTKKKLCGKDLRGPYPPWWPHQPISCQCARIIFRKLCTCWFSLSCARCEHFEHLHKSLNNRIAVSRMRYVYWARPGRIEPKEVKMKMIILRHFCRVNRMGRIKFRIIYIIQQAPSPFGSRAAAHKTDWDEEECRFVLKRRTCGASLLAFCRLHIIGPMLCF